MRPLKEAVKDWNELQIDFAQTQQAPGDNLSKTALFRSALPGDKQQKFLDRVISLVDAYIVRNDIDRALEALNEAERLLGPHEEIVKRLKLIHHRHVDNIPHPKTSQDLSPPPVPRKNQQLDNQIEFLQDLLSNIKKSPYA